MSEPPSETALYIGERIDGRYEVVGELGSGGFATVYEARQLNIERHVALKVLHLDLEDETQKVIKERFIREAQSAARIEHPNVVTIHDFGFLPGSDAPFIIMERLKGRDMADELDDYGAMDPARALKLTMLALGALAEAHEQGIVHKDLKPSNLFITHPQTARESLRVVDFGIAHVVQDKRLTRAGQIPGTPQYLAPEYILTQTATSKLDIYQMGLILVEMLTGRPVVEHPNPLHCIHIHTKGELDLPEELLEGPLGPVLERALAFDPLDRFVSAESFLEALSEIDPGEVHAPVLYAGQKGAAREIADAETGNMDVWFGEQDEAYEREEGGTDPGRPGQSTLFGRDDNEGNATLDSPEEFGAESQEAPSGRPAAVSAARLPVLKKRRTKTLAAARPQVTTPIPNEPTLMGDIEPLGKLSLGAAQRVELKTPSDSGRAARQTKPEAPTPPPRLSQSTTLTAPEPQTSGTPWWMIAAPIVVVLLAAAIVVGIFMMPDGGRTSSDINVPEGFVLIQAGSFTMGSADNEPERHMLHEEAHAVTLTRAFIMARTEVTQAQWLDLMNTKTAAFSDCTQCPVQRVSWWDAALYTNLLSERESLEKCYDLSACSGQPGSDFVCKGVKFKGLSCKGYRLPLEAEWEYAARAGSDRPIHGQLDQVAWFKDNSEERPRPVGGRSSNPWGLYDIQGNVAEWVWDAYDVYPKDSQVDPLGSDKDHQRVYRGCSWYTDASQCRAAFRGYDVPDHRVYDIGFRVVRTW